MTRITESRNDWRKLPGLTAEHIAMLDAMTDEERTIVLGRIQLLMAQRLRESPRYRANDAAECSGDSPDSLPGSAVARI